MVNTNPKDFELFISVLPENILKHIVFVPVRYNNKLPDVEKGIIIKDNSKIHLTVSQAKQRLKNGLNVAVYALYKGLMFVDLDVRAGSFVASKDIINSLDSMNTLKIQTRNGGLQYYFLNNQHYRTQLLKENKKVIGELRNNWSYVLAPGSYVDPDINNRNGIGTYKIIDLCEPKPFLGLDIISQEEISENTKKSIWKHEQEENKISIEEYKNMMKNRKLVRY